MRCICHDTQILFLCFFNDTATTEIYTLSLHDALPLLRRFLSLAEAGPTSFGMYGLMDRPTTGSARGRCAVQPTKKFGWLRTKKLNSLTSPRGDLRSFLVDHSDFPDKLKFGRKSLRGGRKPGKKIRLVQSPQPNTPSLSTSPTIPIYSRTMSESTISTTDLPRTPTVHSLRKSTRL